MPTHGQPYQHEDDLVYRVLQITQYHHGFLMELAQVPSVLRNKEIIIHVWNMILMACMHANHKYHVGVAKAHPGPIDVQTSSL